MKIERVNNNSEHFSKLQDFIETHGLLFNSVSWIKNYPAHQIIQCVVLNNNSEVIGCFNYFEFKKSIFTFIITAPFSPDIALFYVNPAESIVGKNSFDKDLIQSLTEYFDQLNVSYIQINLPANIIDTQPFIWKKYLSKNRYTYLLDLNRTEEELWANLATEKRKSINKAAKDELIIKELNDPDLLYSLVVQSLERNDVAKNTTIIKNILKSFAKPDNSFAFAAYQNDIAIGASFCVYNKEKALYLFGGFNSAQKHHGAGVSCMWQSILKAKSLGLKYFDFEGSMNPAIERYFREFGGQLRPYFCVQKVSPVLKIILKLKGHDPV